MNRQEHYRQRYRELRPEWRDSLVRLIEQVDRVTTPESYVLDIGCGHADFLAPVYARSPFVTGIDPDYDALTGNTTIAMLACGLAEALPFDDESFDLAVSAWVVEHLDDPQTVFSEVYRVLKPGGRVIFLTPNALNYAVWPIRLIPNAFHQRLVKRIYGRDEADTYPVRYRMNTARQVKRVMTGVGFRQGLLIFNGDPTYTSLNDPLFHASRLVEHLLDLPGLDTFKVHLIGVYEK